MATVDEPLSGRPASAGTGTEIGEARQFVQPSQPAPANIFWAWILGIVVVAALGTALVYLRRPDAIARAGSIGPEFVQDETLAETAR